LAAAEAAQILRREQEQQPAIEAVIQGNKEHIEPTGMENADEHKVCGLPPLCIKWLLLGTMVVVAVVVTVAVRLEVRAKALAPTTEEQTVVVTKNPIEIIFDLLRKSIPDISNALTHSNSVEYHAIEWLAEDNGTSFTEDTTALLQRYEIVVFYLESSGSSRYKNSLWKSLAPKCDWYGVVCDITTYIPGDSKDGMSITSLDLSKRKIARFLFLQQPGFVPWKL
jgi:hypothetical protein